MEGANAAAELERFTVARRVTDWNIIADLQRQVADMSNAQRRTSLGRSKLASLRAKLCILDVARIDNMKYLLAGRRHFANVKAITCSVDNTRMGCMDTMYGVMCGAKEQTGEQLFIVLPPQDLERWALGSRHPFGCIPVLTSEPEAPSDFQVDPAMMLSAFDFQLSHRAHVQVSGQDGIVPVFLRPSLQFRQRIRLAIGRCSYYSGLESHIS